MLPLQNSCHIVNFTLLCFRTSNTCPHIMENRVFIFSSKIISFLLISSILFSQCLFWAADEFAGRCSHHSCFCLFWAADEFAWRCSHHSCFLELLPHKWQSLLSFLYTDLPDGCQCSHICVPSGHQ